MLFAFPQESGAAWSTFHFPSFVPQVALHAHIDFIVVWQLISDEPNISPRFLKNPIF